MSDVEKLHSLLESGEHITLECKKSSSEVPKDVWETYSAFANTYGGHILLGIQEHPKETETARKFEIIGIRNPAQRKKEFWDTINSDKVSANILMEQDVEEMDTENGKKVLVIRVPEASYRQKPVYINGNPFKGTFRRNHESDYHCTEEEVRAMLRDSEDTGADGLLLSGYTMDDIDPSSLQAYRNEFNSRNPNHPWSEFNSREFLRNLGGWTKDRRTGEEGLTMAGLLMFGKGISIRERFGNLSFDYLDLSSLLPGQRWTDRISMDGTWENNLYSFARAVLPKLMKNLQKPFQMDGITRIDDTSIHQSVREALINMLIHADYQQMGSLKVVQYEDGFLFSNPGNLKLPVPKIFEGGHTAARNPRIQIMFRMIGLCENTGSGFSLILNTWRKQNWRDPDLYNDLELHKVDLRLWKTEILPAGCSSRLSACFGQAFTGLSEKEKLVLSIALQEGKVTTIRLQPVLKTEPEEIKSLLNDLIRRNMLVPDYSKPQYEYHINLEFHPMQPEKPAVRASASLSETDEELLRLLQKGPVVNQDIIARVDSINTVAGASKAMQRLVDKGLVTKERKTGSRANTYRLKDAAD